MRTQPAPRHLSSRAKAFWRTVLDGHILEPFQLELLRRACEQLDRADQARAVLEREGLTTLDRFGQPKEHPAVAIERQAHLAIARLLRELNLDVSPPDSRPPTLAYGG
jgi:P27 family predicted phage terminase small subunit